MFSSNDDQIIWQINSRKIENHKIQMCLHLIENRILEEQEAKAKEPKSDTQKICILLLFEQLLQKYTNFLGIT